MLYKVKKTHIFLITSSYHNIDIDDQSEADNNSLYFWTWKERNWLCKSNI